MISWTGSNKPLGKIGLVGCGRMGKCMLESMKNNGYEVVAYDKFPAAAEAAKTMGAEVVVTPRELAGCTDVILMSLPGPVQLEEVVFGEEGLIHSLTSDHVVIDTSTVDPDTTRSIASRVAEKKELLTWTVLFWGAPQPSASGCCQPAEIRRLWRRLSLCF